MATSVQYPNQQAERLNTQLYAGNKRMDNFQREQLKHAENRTSNKPEGGSGTNSNRNLMPLNNMRRRGNNAATCNKHLNCDVGRPTSQNHANEIAELPPSVGNQHMSPGSSNNEPWGDFHNQGDFRSYAFKETNTIFEISNLRETDKTQIQFERNDSKVVSSVEAQQPSTVTRHSGDHAHTVKSLSKHQKDQNKAWLHRGNGVTRLQSPGPQTNRAVAHNCDKETKSRTISGCNSTATNSKQIDEEEGECEVFTHTSLHETDPWQSGASEETSNCPAVERTQKQRTGIRSEETECDQRQNSGTLSGEKESTRRQRTGTRSGEADRKMGCESSTEVRKGDDFAHPDSLRDQDKSRNCLALHSEDETKGGMDDRSVYAMPDLHIDQKDMEQMEGNHKEWLIGDIPPHCSYAQNNASEHLEGLQETEDVAMYCLPPLLQASPKEDSQKLEKQSNDSFTEPESVSDKTILEIGTFAKTDTSKSVEGSHTQVPGKPSSERTFAFETLKSFKPKDSGMATPHSPSRGTLILGVKNRQQQESAGEPCMSFSKEFERLRSMHATIARKPHEEFFSDGGKSESLRFIESAVTDLTVAPVFFPPTQERRFWEMWRLTTFSTLQDVAVFAARLAQTGFYYDEELNDICCFSCGLSKREWEKTESPAVIHLFLSPDCDHANCRDTRNVPVSLDSYPQDVPAEDGLEDDSEPLQPDGDQTDTRRPLQIHSLSSHSEGRQAPADEQHASTHATTTPAAAQQSQHTSRAAQRPAGFSEAAENGRYPVQPVQIPHATPNLASNLRGSYEDSGMQSNGPDTGQGALDLRRAYNPAYSTVSKRTVSFSGWPQTALPSSHHMVIAGFYYLGFRDSVRCFYCGVTLRNWRAADDPWVAHVRFRFSCNYLLAIKGDHYIRKTQVAVARGTQAASQVPEEDEPQIAAPLAHTNAAAMNTNNLQDGAPSNPSASHAPSEASRPGSTIQNPTRNGTNNTNPPSETSSASENPRPGSTTQNSRRNSETDNTRSKHSQANRPSSGPSSTSSNSFQSDGESPDTSTEAKLSSIHQHLPSYQVDVGQQTVTVATVMRGGPHVTAVTHGGSRPASNETSPPARQPPARETRDNRQGEPSHTAPSSQLHAEVENGDEHQMQSQLRNLEEERRRLWQRHRCRLCHQRRVDTLFLPCGHLCTCATCANTARECCLCHERIRATSRVLLE